MRAIDFRILIKFLLYAALAELTVLAVMLLCLWLCTVSTYPFQISKKELLIKVLVFHCVVLGVQSTCMFCCLLSYNNVSYLTKMG